MSRWDVARWAVIVTSIAGGMGILGCGSGGPTVYPVHGKVELVGGDVKVLAGCNIEAVQPSNPDLRASGVIGEDGSFSLQSYQAGNLRQGTQAGEYQVRLILSDDDKEARRRAAKALAPRFLQVHTSGLTFQVPTQGDVTLKVSGP